MVVHWKKSKFSTYAACDKRGADTLRLENCKHTDDISKITCKKCRKQYLMSGGGNPGGCGQSRPQAGAGAKMKSQHQKYSFQEMYESLSEPVSLEEGDKEILTKYQFKDAFTLKDEEAAPLLKKKLIVANKGKGTFSITDKGKDFVESVICESSTDDAAGTLDAIIGAMGKRDADDKTAKDILKMGKEMKAYYKKEGSFSPKQAKWIFNTSKGIFK